MNKKNFDEIFMDCENEPIQYIGEIQSFGKLIAIDKNSLDIQIISSNFRQLFNPKLSGPLQSNLTNYFTESSIEQLKNSIENPSLTKDFYFKAQFKTNSKWISFYCYKTKDLVVLEHEKDFKNQFTIKKEYLISSLMGVSLLDNTSKEIANFGQQYAQAIKKSFGYDRVMIYKFHEDYHGEVIAEEKEDFLNPFLGLHFPESDIPVQARTLYLKNLTRIIVDVNSPRIQLFSKNIDVENFDMSDSITRHVSPVHIEYLKNMGVNSTLSISIVVNNKLWGLVACHHYSPKHIPYSSRTLLKFISHSFSTQIARVRSESLSYKKAKVNEIVISLVELLEKNVNESQLEYLKKIIPENALPLKDLMNANGFYLEIGSMKFSIGYKPGKDLLNFIKKSLVTENQYGIFNSNCISKIDSKFSKISKECSGVLALGTIDQKDSCLVAWFRSETLQEINWAGEKTEETKVINGIRRLSPRGSFDVFKNVQNYHSLEFTDEDIIVAKDFLWFVNKVLLKQFQYTQSRVKSLEREAESKDIFISNLSHELRTPLNNILGWLQLYEQKLTSNDELKELANVIKSNANQQLYLVNDLLDTSKLSLGKIELDLRPRTVNKIIHKLVTFFQPTMTLKSIDCQLHEDSNDLICLVDNVRFEQIIRNIIQNSIKFTPKNGKIEIITQKEKSDVLIKVKDSGKGIKKEHISNVFNQFYQDDLSKAKTNQGLGLGLALTKRLVELHGGEIKIESPGENLGCTVTVSLPITSLKVDKKIKKESSKSTQGSLQGVRILLVEDTIESARFIILHLENQGATVVWHNNAADALKLLQKDNRFNIVVSDIGLPNMDGLEFVQEAKKINDTVSYIALSAYGSAKEIDRSKSSGFKEHLVKPVNLNELTQTIIELKI